MRWHRLQILLDMVTDLQDEFGSVCDETFVMSREASLYCDV